MVYPVTRLPVVVEIAPGAAPAGDPADWVWVDVSDRWRYEQGIVIDQGATDWGADVDAGTCSLTFGDHHFSEYNPASEWAGLLGKHTPLRVRLRRGEDGFGRTRAAGWGMADSGQLWSLFGAVGTVQPADATVSGGMGRHWVPAAGGYRVCWLPDVKLLDVEVVVTVDMVISDVLGAPIEPANVALRIQDINTYYLARVQIDAAQAVSVELSSPAGLLASAAVPGLLWTGQPLRVRAGVDDDRLYMRVWDPAGDEPTGWQVEATDRTLTAPGGVGVRSGVAAGNSNAFPVEFAYTDLQVLVDLFGGSVPAWVPPWDKSGKDQTVPVAARGVLYRHQPGQATPPVYSPWRRTITSAARSGLLGYWPCEDGPTATQAASALPGGDPMSVSGGVLFARSGGFARVGTAQGFGPVIEPGTAGGLLPDLSDGGRLTVGVPAGTSSPVAWSVAFVSRVNVGPGATPVVLAEWTTPGGTYVRWELVQQDAFTGMVVYGYTAAAVRSTFLTTFESQVYLTEHRIEAQQSGGNVEMRYYADGLLADSGTFVMSLARVVVVTANPAAAVLTGTGLAVGHIQAWDTATPPSLGYGAQGGVTQLVDSYGQRVYPWYRWLNETAHDRLARLAAEDGIGLSMPPVDALLAVRMGPQPDGPALDLYRQGQAADGGILYERGFSLGYRTRESLYNQAPALVLDAGDDLGEAPEPDGTDQAYRNRVTVTRIDGSSAVAEAPEIRAGALVYNGRADLSLATDRQLPDQTGWRLYVGSHKGLRWPRLEINFMARPDLIDGWLSCRIGSRITATNPPDGVAGQDVDVLLQGYSMRLGYKDFSVVPTCSPAQPWQVATADGTPRVAADGSALAAALPAGGMSLLLTSTAENGPWTTNPGHVPLDMRVGGELVTASSITSAAADNFDRTTSSGFGAATPSGQLYTVSGGAPADYSVGSGIGGTFAQPDPTNVLRIAYLPLPWARLDIQADVSWAIGVAGGAPVTAWLLGGNDMANYYTAQLVLSGGAVTLGIYRRLTGSLTALSGMVAVSAHTAGDWWRIRLIKDGPTRLRAEARNLTAGGQTVMVTASDASALALGGQIVGIGSRRETGNTNTAPVMNVDNLIVTIPQQVTLSARSIGRAWPVWTPVQVANPAIVPL